jgi:predicted TIM-barrel fold metal-dependent hydrolase
VHGYFPFDPLREVYYRRGHAKTGSLAMVRKALTEHGFLGVKLYPPMGFRASMNARPYPPEVGKTLGGDPSADLDRALQDLYALCVELDCPILSHTYPSNEAAPHFGCRADPAFWLPVLEAHPTLRVCFAHFGRFSHCAQGNRTDGAIEESWEWTIGRFIRSHPEARVFADASYFSEVLTAKGEDRKRIVTGVRGFLKAFDPDLTRLVYGSDWIMIGQEAGYPHYIQAVARFLGEECGVSDAALHRFFSGNAPRLLGLAEGAATRDRLLRFYAAHQLDPARLPA